MKSTFAITKISISENGISIEINPSPAMFDELLEIDLVGGAMVVLGSSISIATTVFVAERFHLPEGLFIPLGAGTGIMGVFMGLFPLLYALVKQETLRFSGQYLFLKTTVWGMGRTRRYLLTDLSDVKQVHSTNRRSGKVSFQHGTQRVSFGVRLSPADAQMLVEYLTLNLTFQCHRIEQIYFGKRPATRGIERSTVLYNPDVSSLTIAFVRLKTLVIDVATYDFRLIETFLTYGVNYLGQKYLRNTVT